MAGVFGPIVITQPVTIEGPKADSAQIFADPTAQVGCIGANPPGCALANNGFAVEIAAGVNDTVKISHVLMGAGPSGGAGALKFTSGGTVQLSENVYRGNDTAHRPDRRALSEQSRHHAGAGVFLQQRHRVQ